MGHQSTGQHRGQTPTGAKASGAKKKKKKQKKKSTK